MTDIQNEASLSPNTYILSQDAGTVYRLQKGIIQVFIVSVEHGKLGEPKLYCEIKDTDRQRTVPALIFRENEHTVLCFMIKAGSTGAVLMQVPGATTSVLLQNFLKRKGITSYEEIGFEKSLATFYRETQRIVITGNDAYLSEHPKDVYHLERGRIHVYITPLENTHAGKLLFYCEVQDADAARDIPSLVYTDINYKKWRLQIKAASEEAVLSVQPNSATSELHQQFLARNKISTYDKEGFEKSLVEYYNARIVLSDSVFIGKSDPVHRNAQDNVVNVLKTAFEDGGQPEHTSNSYYQALQFVCGRMHIPLLKADELASRCGKSPSIMDIAKASRFICRRVVLDAGWYQSDCGSFVGTLGKEVIACSPNRKGQYQLFCASDESVVPLTADLAAQISPQAYSIGRTLPLKPLKKKDLFDFCKKSITAKDLLPYIILVLFCSLIGVLLPFLNEMIYDDYVPIGNIGNLVQLCLVMLAFMVGNVSFSIVKNLFGYRVTSRVQNDLQNAIYHRLFHLPESFFRKYDSADLAGRVSGIGVIASRYANTLVLSSISALFSIFYLIRMFTYSGKLTWISIAVYAVYLIIVIAVTSTAQKGQLRIAEAEAESSSKLYQYLNGVDKIRMAGVEDRALLSFLQPYARQQYEEIRVNRLVSIEEALTTVVKSLFSMLFYWVIVKKLNTSDFSVGTFVAFNSAFGAFTGALDSLVNEALSLFQERKEIDRFWPIFDTVPEDDASKEIPGPLSGSITLEHVSFAYDKESKNVLNNLSLDFKPGEYVGIVGPSGCGKSTLLKLLLGFEMPQSGVVLVDGKDLRAIDKGAYRRQLGVVLQNGKLISGTIYENITITAPDTPMARVNEVVQQVGLKEDIQQMPMGLHTMLSENCNTISGGQQQRILIARAICGNPKVLIFDEATSALDNVTQAAVSSSLDKMNVTRIVVAHRLSTIKNCDRILVMNQGEVIQEGTYETLMQDPNGLFYALASRQIAE